MKPLLSLVLLLLAGALALLGVLVVVGGGCL